LHVAAPSPRKIKPVIDKKKGIAKAEALMDKLAQ